MGLLVAERLGRKVDGRLLFEDLGFSLDSGERLAVCGPTGVGKTQLLKLVAWLVAPSSGSLTFEGRTPSEWTAPVWRSRICYVPQRFPSLLETPRAFVDIVYGFRCRQKRSAGDCVAQAQEWDLEPERWQQPWAKLSGGEIQRIALAVALCGGADVLLLDEPTSALDEQCASKVEASLMGTTAIWVTHDRAQAQRVGTQQMELTP